MVVSEIPLSEISHVQNARFEVQVQSGSPSGRRRAEYDASDGQGSSVNVTIPSLASGAKGYFAFLVNLKKSGDFTINFTVEALPTP